MKICRKEGEYRVISMRIKNTTLNKIDDLSNKANRSRNELINIILEYSIDSVEIEEKEFL